ncbi:MBOAT family O-acyltransferase [Clostridium hydrogenum]|uniref:MBOAT family O-acyltransferase n=1 Tax=Clostridium hydrogenum TaxID=2855764 RepID=UPI001F28A2D6|nr:MBOAT family O-acyltransferase [Clostridium hydrogenum]
MLFSSITFIFYFLPLTILLYLCTSFSRTLQNIVLLVLSLIFYTFGEPHYILILLCSILFNYLLGMLIEKFRKKHKISKCLLIIGCVCNLGLLFVFKYLSFFIRNINEAQNLKISVPNIILPIGISFFTLKALSYIIDIYKGKYKADKNPLYIGLYISFFPEVLAGPISTYGNITNQIKTRKHTLQKFSVGACRFITGLGKKVLIANNMAIIVNNIFQMSTNSAVPLSLAWLGSISFAIQIYFDFSGYSDMAVGLGLIFGFKLEENFNYPYMANSITSFWRRWHISLSNWFKNYVYFPLGGSKVANKDMIIRNLLIVWILTGFLHGSEWTFVVWGILNFCLIALEKVISFDELNLKSIYKHIYVLFFINLGWVIFRSNNLVSAGKYISSMFGCSNNAILSNYTFILLKENIFFFIAAIILSMPISRIANKHIVNKTKYYGIFQILYPFFITALFLLSISYLLQNSLQPFIYFKF